MLSQQLTPAQSHALHGAIAVVKDIAGNIIASMQGISVDENHNRQPVYGLGRYTAYEAPAVSFSGSFTCDYFVMKLADFNPIPNAFDNVGSLQQVTSNILLQDMGLEVFICKFIPHVGQPGIGQIQGYYETFAHITDAYLTKNSFSIRENTIVTQNQGFMTLNPIRF